MFLTERFLSNAKSDNRAEIDAFHAFLIHEGIGILDAPRQFGTRLATTRSFADLDGIPFDLVHEPRLDPILGLLVVWLEPSAGLRADHRGPAIHPHLLSIQPQRGCRVSVELDVQCAPNVRVFNG